MPGIHPEGRLNFDFYAGSLIIKKLAKNTFARNTLA